MTSLDLRAPFMLPFYAFWVVWDLFKVVLFWTLVGIKFVIVAVQDWVEQ
jgi:hypothetical protein